MLSQIVQNAFNAARGALRVARTPDPACLVEGITNDSTAYSRYVPDAACTQLALRVRDQTATLQVATAITHKKADVTNTVGAADATTLASSKTLAIELLADAKAHIASTAHHLVAGAVIHPGHKAKDATNTIAAADMSSLGTGYALVIEAYADLLAHAASATFHLAATIPGNALAAPDSEATLVVAANQWRTALQAHLMDTAAHSVRDEVNLALVEATTPATNQASAQTLVNLLKAYHGSHIACFDNTDLASVVMTANACRAGLLTHMASLTEHGGRDDATSHAALTAVAACTDQASANTLLNAEKAQLNAHCAVVDQGHFLTVPAKAEHIHRSTRLLYLKPSASSVIEVAEYRSA